MTETFHSIDDVAELLDLSPRTIWRHIADKKLRTHKFGRSVRIAQSDLEAFIEQNRQ